MKEGLGISKDQYTKVKNDWDDLMKRLGEIEKKIDEQKSKDKGEEKKEIAEWDKVYTEKEQLTNYLKH